MKPTTTLRIGRAIRVFPVLGFLLAVCEVLLLVDGVLSVPSWIVALTFFLPVMLYFFADSSGFGKKFKSIELWDEFADEDVNDYPQTPPERDFFRSIFKKLFFLFAQEWLIAKKNLEAHKKRYSKVNIHPGPRGRLEDELHQKFVRFWHLLESLDLLPFDMTKELPWKDPDSFLQGFYEKDKALDDMESQVLA